MSGNLEHDLQELARRGGFTLAHQDGTWYLAAESGFAVDCTLSSCVEQVMRRQDDLPPLASEILAREKERRGTHPYDFVNESFEPGPAAEDPR